MTSRSTASPSGVVATAFHRLVARRAHVTAVESVGKRFRLVTLEGEELRDRVWRPGYMVQIAFEGWESRAYTPLSYDPEAGAMTFLGYVHGGGIGSDWLESARLGETRYLVGPRAAMNLAALPRPLLFFGDETSISTAAALRATPAGLHGVTCVFEVSCAVEAARSVLERVGLESSLVVLQGAADEQLAHLETRVLGLLDSAAETRVVLTGKASSIQRLYKALRRADVPPKQVTNIAYWAPGRKGFSGVQR